MEYNAIISNVREYKEINNMRGQSDERNITTPRAYQLTTKNMTKFYQSEFKRKQLKTYNRIKSLLVIIGTLSVVITSALLDYQLFN
jgi:hypothetical protein